MIGTTGFHGERLREAREARGLSAIQFAEMVNVTKQMVNLYERAKCSPAPDTFDLICLALHFPKQFFLRPPAPQSLTPVFYRSLASATKQMRDRAERRYAWFRQLTEFVSRYVQLPGVNIPDLNAPSDPAKLSSDFICNAATLVRRHWNLGDGVISNVVLLMENHGVPATRYHFEAEELDAFSNWDETTNRPYLVLGADKASQVRSRFDAAHELAHLVLHRNVPKDLLKVPSVFRLVEEQAHHFTRAFLLPTSTFGNEYVPPSIDSLPDLKKKWRVSIGVIIARAAELGLLTKQQAKQLWINRTRRKWHVREPFDDVWEPEQPLLIRRSIELLLKAGVVTGSRITDSLMLYASDVEGISGLPDGALRPADAETVQEPEPRLLPFSRKRPAEG